MLLTFIICYFQYLQLKSFLTLLLKCVHEEGCGAFVKVALEEYKHLRKKELKTW